MNHDLYYKAVAADDAWSDELTRLFGKDAGNVRYTGRAKGVEGSELNRLYWQAQETAVEWRLAQEAAREIKL